MQKPIDFLDACIDLLGAEYVITEVAAQASYLSEWRKRKIGKARAILRPGTSAEVAAVVKLCVEHKIALVPQGGNTGLVYGGIPDQSGEAVLISLQRLNRIRHVDVDNNTVTVEAGCLLHTIQEVAIAHDRFFPLSLASEGSCTIGGNLSTNAGGTAVLRYGNTRELCLGLEVVTAQGEIWNGLRCLRKDNTGYDLRDLFIGAEGTLGIITAAVMKLYPRNNVQICAFVALHNIEDAVALLNRLKQYHSEHLSGFELMNAMSLTLVESAFPDLHIPLRLNAPYYVLIEVASNTTEEQLRTELEASVAAALDYGLLSDAVITQNITQFENCWKIRESISEAQAHRGKNIKHDISLPISNIASFVEHCNRDLSNYVPNCQFVTFGHLGDGNLHYNVSAPEGILPEKFLESQEEINRIVHDLVHHYDGSISAEHGIGTLKKEELRRYKSDIELDMMRQIKRALDPLNIMNPGKIF